MFYEAKVGDMSKDSLNNIENKIDELGTLITNTKSVVDTVNTNVTSVNSSVGTINKNVSSVKSTVSTINTNVNTANTNITTIKSNIGSTIKSIQRGLSSITACETKTITINSVTPEKCLVILNGGGWTVATGALNNSDAIFNSLSATSLVVGTQGYTGASTNGSASFSWQVIEYA